MSLLKIMISYFTYDWPKSKKCSLNFGYVIQFVSIFIVAQNFFSEKWGQTVFWDFFWFHDLTRFDAKIFEIQIFFLVKISLDTKPFDCLNTIFFRNWFLGLQSTKCKMVYISLFWLFRCRPSPRYCVNLKTQTL